MVSNLDISSDTQEIFILYVYNKMEKIRSFSSSNVIFHALEWMKSDLKKCCYLMIDML